MICFGMVACHITLPEVRRLFSNAVVRMGKRHDGADSKTWSKGGTARNGDQEAIYMEFTWGDYPSLRLMPLTEEYYCPQVPLANNRNKSAVWKTSWHELINKRNGKLKYRPYACRAVHGHMFNPVSSSLSPLHPSLFGMKEIAA